jgi:hypothetical protein
VIGEKVQIPAVRLSVKLDGTRQSLGARQKQKHDRQIRANESLETHGIDNPFFLNVTEGYL